jgi:DNA-binding NarL/FixJ family response regulator
VSIHETGTYHPKSMNKYVKIVMSTKTHVHLQLSEKERLFLKLCCGPDTYCEIGKKMHKSVDSINDLRQILFKKTELNTRQELVMFALKAGIVSPYATSE